ncbi:S1 family peptidase [Rhodococcus qingshengii]|uniref:S1 family peptidase n=1 Tax=Rhodococcus qingshengii TaxID=334542 RepID=UPI0021B0C244|nr:S1 family peptidase [Rhodococcus qingshengii]MCT6735350.1 S1 family peptidase [Rhodococcus qingshengii]
MNFRSIFAVLSAAFLLASVPAVSSATPGVLSPADPLVTVAPDGSTETCTLGFLFSGPDGYARGVTAAHCGKVDQKVSTTNSQAVGTITAHGKDDVALIDINTKLKVFGKIPGVGDIRGVITPGEINRVQPVLCKRGIASGLMCGRLTEVAEDGFFVMSGGSIRGDSGSPVWAVSDDGSLLAAGIVSGVMADETGDAFVIPIAPYMRQWGLTISG